MSIILDLLLPLTIGIVTIFNNNFIPGHNREELKILDFSSFSHLSRFLSFQQVLTQYGSVFSKIIWLELLSEGVWRLGSAFWAITKPSPNN